MITIEELFKKSLILRKELLNDTDRFKDSKNLHLNILAQIVAEFFKSPYLPESIGIKPPERLSRSVFKDNCNEVFKKLGVNYQFYRSEMNNGTIYIFKLMPLDSDFSDTTVNPKTSANA